MNPIIEKSTLKYNAVPFDQIRPDHFLPAMDEAINKGRRILEEIKSKPASFENTILGLERSTEDVEFVNLVFNNLLLAHGNDELQKLSMEMGPKAAAFTNDILLDPDIFARVKEVYDKRDQLASDPEGRYLVEKLYLDFSRSGANLDPEAKNRLRAIDERLSQLQPKFRENVLKYVNDFELWIDQESDLAGLPKTARDAAKEAAKEKGHPDKWLFTLQYPSYQPFMRFSEKRELREKLYRAYFKNGLGGKYDNRPVIEEIIALMTEKANLLGSKNFAEWALQTRMAETPQTVMEFLHKMLTVVKPAAEKDVREVQQLADEMGGPNPLQQYDFLFYSEKLKEKKYAFDEESLRPYFKLENVLSGVFHLANRLFNLKFTLNKDLPVYHPDVQVYEVTREKTGEFMGLFYADFFPRATKSSGAWMTNFFEQGTFRGERIRPHVSIVCNFTKPTSERPSLLTFDEVKTIFHEFGHALHSLLSNVKYRSLAGTNVYLDFVELPSQIMENWAEEEELLKTFAVHYQTGEVLPRDLLQRLKASQRFQAGYLALRQLRFAMLDMNWFMNPPADNNITAFEAKVLGDISVLPDIPETCTSTAFQHIFGGGYSSGYYSYKWAEALDADAFEYFKEKGIFDRETARRFEECILSKGGSDHPMRLYEKFRGRKPDPEALLRRDGLIS